MATGFLLFNRPDDQLADNVTPTILSGAFETDYGVTRLTDGHLGSPLKCTSGAFELQWDFGADVQPKFAALGHIRAPGGTITIGSHTASGGPFTLVGTFVLPAIGVDGFYDNPYLDLGTPTARRYWNLKCVGATANAIVGEYWLGSALRQVTHGHQPGLEREDDKREVVIETVAGVELGYDWGTRQEALANLTFITTRSVGLPILLDLWRSAGRTKPFPLVVDPDVNKCLFVKFRMKPFVQKGSSVDVVAVTLSLREISRGLKW
jgi:hypothetical protein